MAVFKDAEDVYSTIGKAMEVCVNDDQFVKATQGGTLVVHIIQTDPDAHILVDFPGRKVLTGVAAENASSTVQLRMSSDNANKFWQGKLNFTLAMAQRKVKLDGKRSTALGLLPLTEPIFEAYRQILTDAHRDDLLL
ncbi:hypothetical protein GOPIP_062_00230 [Gordonia polyisoprenivorans NBRC 16320 = JCM 10675]|uniref:SCP2 sterol-binding domain-containing protein n=1 Tax=Gordonia polyisoprenivorans TaxID=84595 RepID=A0A846WXM6_9ACTN|nr:SCP2 sterol-binding domain-containing protein [Gordonia polyisoprenivorans]NKY05191.1 SCP2 sterol-binding domain-containing protein [Gordonia polyisoprenivorans]GAB24072.1 hypothetical protein GOPIP_062_00230 [Gordonia polyisoprenivorans NBRC 16320 = JCM 10675]